MTEIRDSGDARDQRAPRASQGAHPILACHPLRRLYGWLVDYTAGVPGSENKGIYPKTNANHTLRQALRRKPSRYKRASKGAQPAFSRARLYTGGVAAFVLVEDATILEQMVRGSKPYQHKRTCICHYHTHRQALRPEPPRLLLKMSSILIERIASFCFCLNEFRICWGNTRRELSACVDKP